MMLSQRRCIYLNISSITGDFFKNGKYACPLCYTTYKKSTYILTHIRKFHKNDKELLQRSVEEHELNVQCSECKLKFIDRKYMKIHLAGIHHLGRKGMKRKNTSVSSKALKHGKFTCPLCYSSYKDVRYLSTHIKVHHQDDKEMLDRTIEDIELTVQCTECELKFVKESFMELHRGKKHKDKGFRSKIKSVLRQSSAYGCPLCYNGFRLNLLLSQHLKKVHKNDQDILNRTIEDHELIIKCSECEMKFVNERFMNLHKARMHSKTAYLNNGRYTSQRP